MDNIIKTILDRHKMLKYLSTERYIVMKLPRAVGKTTFLRDLIRYCIENYGMKNICLLRPSLRMIREEYGDLMKKYSREIYGSNSINDIVGRTFDLIVVDEYDDYDELLKRLPDLQIRTQYLIALLSFDESDNNEGEKEIDKEMNNQVIEPEYLMGDNPKNKEDWNKVEEKLNDLIFTLHNELGWFNDEELKRTPHRVMNFFKEWYENGQWNDFRLFENGDRSYGCEKYDELIVLKDVEVCSMCSHHMLPFIGKCHIAYLPDKKVCGVSKLARVVRKFASRPQIQEQLSNDIVEYLKKELNPKFVMVVIECQHMCMKIRGIKQYNSKMMTSAIRYSDDLENEDIENLKNEAMRLFGL